MNQNRYKIILVTFWIYHNIFWNNFSCTDPKFYDCRLRYHTALRKIYIWVRHNDAEFMNRRFHGSVSQLGWMTGRHCWLKHGSGQDNTALKYILGHTRSLWFAGPVKQKKAWCRQEDVCVSSLWLWDFCGTWQLQIQKNQSKTDPFTDIMRDYLTVMSMKIEWKKSINIMAEATCSSLSHDKKG